MNDSKIKLKLDSFFYELTFTPFTASAFFYLVAIGTFIYAFDPYSVVRFGTMGILFLLVAVAGFLYWNVHNLPLIFSAVSVGYFFASGYQLYSYFSMNPIQKFQSISLFGSIYNYSFLYSALILFSALMGTMYLMLGFKKQKDNEYY